MLLFEFSALLFWYAIRNQSIYGSHASYEFTVYERKKRGWRFSTSRHAYPQMTQVKHVLISTCGFHSKQNNYEGLEKQFEICFGNINQGRNFEKFCVRKENCFVFLSYGKEQTNI